MACPACFATAQPRRMVAASCICVGVALLVGVVVNPRWLESTWRSPASVGQHSDRLSRKLVARNDRTLPSDLRASGWPANSGRFRLETFGGGVVEEYYSHDHAIECTMVTADKFAVRIRAPIGHTLASHVFEIEINGTLGSEPHATVGCTGTYCVGLRWYEDWIGEIAFNREGDQRHELFVKYSIETVDRLGREPLLKAVGWFAVPREP